MHFMSSAQGQKVTVTAAFAEEVARTGLSGVLEPGQVPAVSGNRFARYDQYAFQCINDKNIGRYSLPTPYASVQEQEADLQVTV